jgi:hypothetical protein
VIQSSLRLCLFNLGLWFCLSYALLALVPPGSVNVFRVLFAAIFLIANFFVARRLSWKEPGALRERSWLVFLLCFLSALILFFLRMSAHPHGMWDAWAAWNPKAAFFAENFLGGNPFTVQLRLGSQPGYPLALPMSLGALGSMAGGWSPILPQLAHASFFLVHWLLFFCIARRGVPAQPVWAGLCAALPALTFQASDQCADFPLSLALAGGTYLVTRPWDSETPILDLWIAGICAGLLPNLKNEGLITGLAFLAFVFWSARSQKWPMRWVFVIVVPVLILWASYFYLRAQSPEAPRFVGDLAAYLRDPARYIAVIKYDLLLLTVVTLLLPVALAMRTRSYAALLPWVGLWAVYSAFFVITTYPQEWHLATAHFRLHLQFLPAFFVVLLLAPIRGKAAENE